MSKDAEPYKTKIRIIGNSKGLLIPFSVVKLLDLKEGTSVLVLLRKC